MPYEEFTTDNYMDQNGRIWFCVRVNKEGRMSCEGENGAYTAASFATFKRWGWTKTDRSIAALS